MTKKMNQHSYIFNFDPGYNGWSRLRDPFARWLCVGGMVGGACAVAVFNDGDCLAMGERVGVFCSAVVKISLVASSHSRFGFHQVECSTQEEA